MPHYVESPLQSMLRHLWDYAFLEISARNGNPEVITCLSRIIGEGFGRDSGGRFVKAIIPIAR
jgi:hypothetical protein